MFLVTVGGYEENLERNKMQIERTEEEILEQGLKKVILEEEVFLQTLAALMVLIITVI